MRGCHLILANTANSVIRILRLSGGEVAIQELSVEHGAQEIFLSFEDIAYLYDAMKEQQWAEVSEKKD